MFKISTFVLLTFLIISCQNQKEANLDIEQLNQIESNQKTLQALKDAGETFKVSRDIFHWIYFKKRNDLNNFLKEAKSKGYQLVGINIIDDNLPYQLQIKINDHISENIMHGQVIYLLDSAKRHNGDYDGWETSVEK